MIKIFIDKVDENIQEFVIKKLEEEKLRLVDRDGFLIYRKEKGKYFITNVFFEREHTKEEFYEFLNKELGKEVDEYEINK